METTKLSKLSITIQGHGFFESTASKFERVSECHSDLQTHELRELINDRVCGDPRGTVDYDCDDVVTRTELLMILADMEV